MAETALSRDAVYTARPTVRIDGQPNAQLDELMVAMEMTETEGGMSALELTVQNTQPGEGGGPSGLAWEGGDVLALGKAIAIYSGDEREPREVFRGVITGLEGVWPLDGAPELVVLAEDALQRARMARRTAVHENAKISDLAGALASRLSLTPVITGLTDGLGTQVQMNESDLAFLRRLLADRDADLQVVGTELHVSPRGDVRRGTVELEMRPTGQLLAARALADLSHQATEVTATGWDPAQGARISASSTGAHAGPGSGQKGADALREALGERKEHVRELAVLNDAEARALADAFFDQRARRFVTVEATAQGNPAIRVGTHVTLKGMGPRFDNTYYVVRCTHRFDPQDGYMTHFEGECAFLGQG
ncbi:MAG TPA: contractile injection system protein, VgrG/Pvc8 family [Longimicrobium sp.]|nr:contractile injection system protein, VgrG/Pvc8 family [Longimicrobium sp.]